MSSDLLTRAQARGSFSSFVQQRELWLWALVGIAHSDFQGAVGALCASTVPAAFTASVVGRTRALAEPRALADHLHEDGVCQEAIENRHGRRDVAEKDAPVLRGPI